MTSCEARQAGRLWLDLVTRLLQERRLAEPATTAARLPNSRRRFDRHDPPPMSV